MVFLLFWMYLYPKLKDVEIKGTGLIIDNNLIKWKEIRSINFTVIGLYKVEIDNKKEIFVIPAVPPKGFLNEDFNSDPFSLALKDFNKNRKHFFPD